MQFTWYSFDQMEASQAIAMLSLRHRVFGEEQLYAGQEVDDWDKVSQHLCVTEGKEVLACLRLCQLISDTYDTYEIGRLCVAPEYRHQGIGKKMVNIAILKGMGNGMEAKIETSAPAYLSKFYRSAGFETVGDPWAEDAIPHVFLRLSKPSLLENLTLEPLKRPSRALYHR